jgi:methyl-accepting chemotaxis protein
MFKNLNLAAKIGIGFAAVIILMIVLGSIALINMNSVSKDSDRIASVNMPAVTLEVELERTINNLMFTMRGYSLTESDAFLKEARERMNQVTGKLDETLNFANGYSFLGAMQNSLKDINGNTTEYKAKMDETIALIEEIKHDREVMDENAAAFMTESMAYLRSQDAALIKEIDAGAAADKLKERHWKITQANNVIDLGNAARVGNFKAQAQRNPEALETVISEFSKYDTLLDELKNKTRNDANLRQIASVRKAAKGYRQAMQNYIKHGKTMAELNKSRNDVALAALEATGGLSAGGLDRTSAIADNAAGNLQSASVLMIIGLVVAGAIGIVLAFIITLSITRPVSRIISALTSGAEQVTSASTQVASSSQQMAEGASEQASSLEEISSSLEEMTSMTRQNADNSRQANQFMSEAGTMVNTGMEATKRMSSAIDEIKNSSDETAKIIKTIDEIAFQTNLLALNAAVEAARAGEAGKGFAVVAEEVRNLAQRSAEAAKNTADLIEGAQKNADNGVQVSQELAEALEQIVGSSEKVSNLIGEISAASSEQAQGIEQVNTAVAEMDKVVQSNAANAEESASASEELSAQAQEVDAIVIELSGLIHGQGSNGNHAVQRAPVRRTTPVQRKAAPARLPARMPAHSAPAQPEEVIPLDDSDFSDF